MNIINIDGTKSAKVFNIKLGVLEDEQFNKK